MEWKAQERKKSNQLPVKIIFQCQIQIKLNVNQSLNLQLHTWTLSCRASCSGPAHLELCPGGSSTCTATFCFSRVFNILPCTLWVSFTSSRSYQFLWLLTLEEALWTLWVVLRLRTLGVALGLWTLGVVLWLRTPGVTLEPLPLKVILGLYPIAGLPNSLFLYLNDVSDHSEPGTSGVQASAEDTGLEPVPQSRSSASCVCGHVSSAARAGTPPRPWVLTAEVMEKQNEMCQSMAAINCSLMAIKYTLKEINENLKRASQ